MPELKYTGIDIANAYQLANGLHYMQLDKGGNRYIDHLVNVANMAGDLCQPQEVNVIVPAALLHDSLEDTDATAADLRQYGVDPLVIMVVCGLTHAKGESRDEYIGRVAKNRVTSIVKIADLTDNMRLERLNREPTQKDYERTHKYYSERKLLSRIWGIECG